MTVVTDSPNKDGYPALINFDKGEAMPKKTSEQDTRKERKAEPTQVSDKELHKVQGGYLKYELKNVANCSGICHKTSENLLL